MDIRGRRRSTNIEDRRGMRVGRPVLGVGIGGLILMVVLSLLGINPLPFLTGLQEVQQQQNPQMEPGDQPYQEHPVEAQLRELTEVVLADTEETWNALLPQRGIQYQEPTLVLFTDAVQSECGGATAASGPFYCPLDQKVYLDLSFYQQLQERFGAPGDTAEAYVIAHEVGHHVQNLAGIASQVREAQERNPGRANDLSVRMELQADCYAGVWANNADQSRQLLEAGDIEEALNAASAIGDDRIQRQTQGQVMPDSFTHGSGEQRQRWFMQGYQSGNPDSCDTFRAARI
jgi:predicted metalloprotease